MNGLKYIRSLYGDTGEKLSSKLGVTKVTVSKWENGVSKIPSKRVEQLSQIYSVPKKYFTMELSRSDELKIKLKKLSDEYDDTIVTDEIPVSFDDEGIPTEYAPITVGNDGYAEAIRHTEFDLKVEQFIVKLKDIIYNNHIDYDDEMLSTDYIIGTEEENLGLIKKFALLMKRNDSMFLAYILRAIELSENNSEDWGEIPYLDRNGLTKKVATVIKEWKADEKKRQEAEYQEYKELFGVEDEDEMK